jgi:hypothetical protein
MWSRWRENENIAAWKSYAAKCACSAFAVPYYLEKVFFKLKKNCFKRQLINFSFPFCAAGHYYLKATRHGVHRRRIGDMYLPEGSMSRSHN